MAPFDRSYTSSYWRFIVTVALFCIISEIRLDIGRKSRFFHTPREFDTAVMGVWVGILRLRFVGKKPDGKKVWWYV